MAMPHGRPLPVIDILEQTPDHSRRLPVGVFLRNHDELTLEMVTDEERDYMYRVYAAGSPHAVNVGIRRRLAPLMDNDAGIELMNALLLRPARHADHLLRRRNRHGRQYLSRRPQRRAHPDAVEAGPQRRLLARQPPALYLPVITSIRSITLKSSTSKPSRATRIRCSGGSVRRWSTLPWSEWRTWKGSRKPMSCPWP